MGTTTETPLLTFEEFERLPERPGKSELLRGELIELQPAQQKHNRIAHRIYDVLKAALAAAHSRGQACELGEVYHETGYQLGENSWVQPDVSVTHTSQTENKYLEGAPVIAVEVISPGNRARHVDVKTELYFEHGAREVWQIYQDTRKVVVYTGSASNIRVEHQAVTTPLLPGFSLTIPEILSD